MGVGEGCQQITPEGLALWLGDSILTRSGREVAITTCAVEHDTHDTDTRDWWCRKALRIGKVLTRAAVS